MERLIEATSVGVITPDLYAGVTTLSLRVIDTGKGFSPEVRTRIFTPFHSTKRDGQGIDFTMIREILVNHSLAINLESPRPRYTEFRIDFAAAEPRRPVICLKLTEAVSRNTANKDDFVSITNAPSTHIPGTEAMGRFSEVKPRTCRELSLFGC